ncbi:DeoR/GlpR transcriptional regulator [Herbiconiux sp. VKM Ac-1786]|uniref:DeoR/GlpR family DNA-binding transcription regulator n=1 Tax=Herbiconiux sp. VKM Ac-1786 TaxID=2783824 RepID=UPI00188BD9C9|nr:DeoR/GlpR transcriptional regulator [Herbiconiux sp. VKM Ac-1786]
MSRLVLTSSAVTERRSRIVASLELAGRVDVGELAMALGVAEETVRRDLRALETEGLLRRAHGGAIPVETEAGHRLSDSGSAARAVAEEVRASVPHGAAVFLDAGAVGEALARLLDADSGVRIVTASVPVALSAALVSEPAEIHLLGGAVDDDLVSTGEWARSLARTLRVDLAVFEPTGVAGGRMLTADPDRATIATAVAALAARIVLAGAAPSRQGFAGSVELADVDHAVVSAGVLDASVLQVLAEQGATVTEVAA